MHNFKSSIEFIKGVKETVLPIIKLTKSKNGKTGTATFVFIEPFFFQTNYYYNLIEGVSLIWEKKTIVTNDITIFFKNGKPFIAKVIFLFKNKEEWFNFLNFINFFSKETGLYFSELNSSFKK